MAGKTTANVENKAGDMVTIRLPRNPGQNASQDEFYSLNFVNYIIKRGQDVEVPRALAEIILNGQKAEEDAALYAEEKAQKQQ